MKAMVDPLPLVPATWIVGGRRFCGSPRDVSNRSMRPSDRSIFLGCSGRKRERIVSVSIICYRLASAKGLHRQRAWRGSFGSGGAVRHLGLVHLAGTVGD